MISKNMLIFSVWGVVFLSIAFYIFALKSEKVKLEKDLQQIREKLLVCQDNYSAISYKLQGCLKHVRDLQDYIADMKKITQSYEGREDEIETFRRKWARKNIVKEKSGQIENEKPKEDKKQDMVKIPKDQWMDFVNIYNSMIRQQETFSNK